MIVMPRTSASKPLAFTQNIIHAIWSGSEHRKFINERNENRLNPRPAGLSTVTARRREGALLPMLAPKLPGLFSSFKRRSISPQGSNPVTQFHRLW